MLLYIDDPHDCYQKQRKSQYFKPYGILYRNSRLGRFDMYLIYRLLNIIICQQYNKKKIIIEDLFVETTLLTNSEVLVSQRPNVNYFSAKCMHSASNKFVRYLPFTTSIIRVKAFAIYDQVEIVNSASRNSYFSNNRYCNYLQQTANK